MSFWGSQRCYGALPKVMLLCLLCWKRKRAGGRDRELVKAGLVVQGSKENLFHVQAYVVEGG